MALNPLKVCWLEHLYKKGAFTNRKTLLELGPQDLTTKKDFIAKTISHRFKSHELERLLENIYDSNGKPKANFQSHFYKLWGIEEYSSLDFFDNRADFKCDLNYRVELNASFDIVTNFGTAEHIFNIGSLYENIHYFLNPGGLALHINPTYGDINHGFYNIHPNVYSQLIKTNNYIQHSLEYVENYVGKNGRLGATLESYNFESPRISLGSTKNNFGDMSSLQKFRAKVFQLFTENIRNPHSLEFVTDKSRGCFDYTFAALEKTSNTPFKVPQQYSEQVTLLAN